MTKSTAANPSSPGPSPAPSGQPDRGPSGHGLMPVLFVGHGSPMNAIEDNRWSEGFRALARLVPRPKAVLAVSAHWFVGGTFTTGNPHPKTIHDFGGFPEALYAVGYPAPGDVALADHVTHLIGDGRAAVRLDWGLDHGTWSVLHHMLPAAEVPVVQLSIDGRRPAADHLAIGRALAPLRAEGVLILGSGNITHNLRYAIGHAARGALEIPGWAASFDADVERALLERDEQQLTEMVSSETGRMAHPTPDHYLPLLYAAGAAEGRGAVSFPITGFALGSLSMRSVLFT